MNVNRELIQSEAIKRLKDNSYSGTVVLSTGTGKSKIAIEIIKNGFDNVLILVPRTNLIKNWNDEIIKWFGNPDNHKTIVIDTIQKCYKWKKNQLQDFKLLIIDEIHFLSEKYSSILKNIPDIPVIGLTATPNLKDDFKREVLYKKIPIIYSYYNSEQDGLINKIKYYVFEYQLNNGVRVPVTINNKTWFEGEKDRYDYLTKRYENAKRNMFALGANNYFEDALMWMKSYNQELKNAGRNFFYSVKNRKEFLWTLNSSKNIAVMLKHKILSSPNNKLLIFSELTEQAEKLSAYSVHSNNGDTAKQNFNINSDLIKKFNSGKIRELSSCLSLTLGLNLVGANWAIFESYSGSDVSSRQRSGRTHRLPIEEIANIVIIKPVDTQADKWFDNGFKWIKEYKIINSVHELEL